jgi:ribosomal protein L37AE/L43A
MVENLEYVKNLEKYYKYINICKRCNRKYGSDLKQKIFCCPICEERLKGRISKILKSYNNYKENNIGENKDGD